MNSTIDLMERRVPDRFAAVLTTIQPPTPAVHRLARHVERAGGELVVVGDAKGPPAYDLLAARFLPLADQRELPFRLAAALPTGHYARKNLGYLDAIGRGAKCLFETDDDNAPLERWTLRTEVVEVVPIREADGWVNVYRAFSDARIWPRGFPLEHVAASCSAELEVAGTGQAVRAPIQQALANGAPDVDAVWRLVLDQPFTFEEGPSVLLPPGTWCPFNSQSTWWWPVAFPLLYLPSHCSFRMTDIWRSFVAQRCLWALGMGVVFHAAEVEQERNEHNLMRDFADEIPGYTRNAELVRVLGALELGPGADAVGDNLLRCYEALVTAGFFPHTELGLVRAWLEDLARVSDSTAGRGTQPR